MKKKVLAIAGATVLTVSLLAGATYAWFTNTATVTTNGTITGGQVEIAATGERTDTDIYPLFPQLTDQTTGAPIQQGTIEDVANFAFQLTNKSDRQVLVEVAKDDIMTVVNLKDGTSVTIPTDDDKIKTYLKFGDNTAAKYAEFNNKYYIHLPYNETVSDLTLQVWIDSEAGNDYKNCVISFKDSKLGSATAVQYREAAIREIFQLGDTEIWHLLNTYKMPDFE